MAPRKATLSPDQRRELLTKFLGIRIKVENLELKCKKAQQNPAPPRGFNVLLSMRNEAVNIISNARDLLDQTNGHHPTLISGITAQNFRAVALIDRVIILLNRAEYILVRLEDIAYDWNLYEWAQESRKNRKRLREHHLYEKWGS